MDRPARLRQKVQVHLQRWLRCHGDRVCYHRANNRRVTSELLVRCPHERSAHARTAAYGSPARTTYTSAPDLVSAVRMRQRGSVVLRPPATRLVSIVTGASVEQRGKGKVWFLSESTLHLGAGRCYMTLSTEKHRILLFLNSKLKQKHLFRRTRISISISISVGVKAVRRAV